MLVFDSDAIKRTRYASYPIFSLHKSDTGSVAEFRDIVTRLSFSPKEIELPGKEEPEIGFALSWDECGTLAKKTYEIRDQGVLGQFFSWYGTPTTTPIPEVVDIPDNCYMPIDDELQRIARKDRNSSFSLLLLNVPTGQVIKVYVNNSPPILR